MSVPSVFLVCSDQCKIAPSKARLCEITNHLGRPFRERTGAAPYVVGSAPYVICNFVASTGAAAVIVVTGAACTTIATCETYSITGASWTHHTATRDASSTGAVTNIGGADSVRSGGPTTRTSTISAGATCQTRKVPEISEVWVPWTVWSLKGLLDNWDLDYVFQTLQLCNYWIMKPCRCAGPGESQSFPGSSEP